MKKRTVLIAVHQLNLGGVQKALISALNAIDYTKNEVTLYVRKNRTDLLSQVNPNVSRIVINQDTAKYYRKPYAIWLQALLKLSRSEAIHEKLNQFIVESQMKYEKEHYFSDETEYDIAVSYIQSHTAKFVVENINAKRKVMFYHGSTDEYHEINEKVMQDYDRIICVSPGALEAVKGFYPQYAGKMSCIENYVDADEVRAKASEFTPDYPKNKLILCSCGRFTSVKGFDLAVEAARNLRDKGLDYVWYFVGDGPDRNKIEALIGKYQLEKYITITGLQSNPYPYIKSCTIYVQPSYEEAQGLSIIEAQILCKPVVSTATAGGQSIINEGINGVLSEIDPVCLADKIHQTANDNALRKRIEKQLSSIDYQADYERFCRQWAELLGDE